MVVQKPARQLESSQCSVDDGSLSVYAGQRNIEYICLEADAAAGASRQKQMLAAVYRLLTESGETEPSAAQSFSKN